MLSCLDQFFTKGGWSTNKFRKSPIRKLAASQNLLHLRTLRKYGNYRICDLLTQIFLRFAYLQFADPIFFWTLNFRKYKNFPYTYTVHLKWSYSNLYFSQKQKLSGYGNGARALHSFICYSWIIDSRCTFPFTLQKQVSQNCLLIKHENLWIFFFSGLHI